MNLSKKSKEILIKSDILNWYKKNKRDLPWRKTSGKSLPNPYHIFVSEFMLQQTTVGTVKKRFNEFINKWPSLNDLASKSESTILNFWSGLGYYSRARNLLKAAKIIKKKHASKIPDNFNDLIILPGIGEYTAKAILGIAYNKSVMPLDANIERIFARLYGFKSPISKIKSELKILSNNYISKKFSNQLIQGFMDFGSIICTPRNPDCINCIVKHNCIAFKKNLQKIIPIKSKSNQLKKKKYSRAYIFYNEENEILVRRRSSKGMLASMLEIPNDKWVIDKNKLVYDKIVQNLTKKIQYKGSIEYSFSHFDLETEVFFANVKKNHFLKYKWMKKNNFKKSGLPTVMKKIIEVAI